MIVVLPTPGPPVTMHTFDRSARRTALSCAGASVKPVFCSHHLIARSGSISPKDCGASSSWRSFAATRFSLKKRFLR